MSESDRVWPLSRPVVVGFPAVAFTVIGHPEPAGSKRALRNPATGRIHVTDANRNAKPWQAVVAAAGHEAMQGCVLFAGPLELRIVFYRLRPKGHYGTGRNGGRLRASAPAFPCTRPDVLKLARGVEDALTGVCWRDDAQIVSEVLGKRFGEPARAEVAISTYPDGGEFGVAG